MHTNETSAVDSVDRWTLTRDIALLQVKLIVDGLRDFILVPVSLIVGLISLFSPGRSDENEFYRLLRIGRKSEKWINLFGAADRVRPSYEERVNFPQEDIDTLVQRLENLVVDEYRSGGVTRQARDQLEQLLAAVQRRRRKRSSELPPR
jgi:hypothetical protein